LSKNNINLKNFHISLLAPIEILLFKEILSILISKYNFSAQSKQTVGLYEIDSNQKIIIKNKIKGKLTEKEVQLILLLNRYRDIGIKKEDLLNKIWGHRVNLETHAFETHLHRLRKKIVKYFKDREFIIEKDSLYFICK
jgi:DNA-binding response OmpR family regulator